MLQDFLHTSWASITLEEAVLNLAVAFLAGMINVRFYRMIYRGPGYAVSFLNSLVALSLISALVIMIIGDNLARAFGLVGAMSIIRFRTAVKETMDITFVFFALATGMAAGVGLHAIAFASSLVIGLILMFMTKAHLISSSAKELLLQFTFTPTGTAQETPYTAGIDKHTRNNKLVNVRTQGEALELSYYVNLKNKNDHVGLIRELKQVPGVGQVNLYEDDERF